MSGHINHVGNFREKIKFCCNIHLCLLEETIQRCIDHAASFLPHRCKFTSGAAREIRMDIDGLLGSLRESSHLLCGDPREEGTGKVPQSPLAAVLSLAGCQLLLLSPLLTAHTCEHTHLPHPPTLSTHSWGWFLCSFVFNSFWPLKLRSKKARVHCTGTVFCTHRPWGHTVVKPELGVRPLGQSRQGPLVK